MAKACPPAALITEAPARSDSVKVLNIDVLFTVAPCACSPEHRVLSVDVRLNSPRFGKRKRCFDSPRRQSERFPQVALLLGEGGRRMVNCRFASRGANYTSTRFM